MLSITDHAVMVSSSTVHDSYQVGSLLIVLQTRCNMVTWAFYMPKPSLNAHVTTTKV